MPKIHDLEDCLKSAKIYLTQSGLVAMSKSGEHLIEEAVKEIDKALKLIKDQILI